MKFKDLKIGTKVITGYSIALIMMSVIAVVIYLNVNTLIDSANMVSHTNRVMAEGNDLITQLVNMEIKITPKRKMLMCFVFFISYYT